VRTSATSRSSPRQQVGIRIVVLDHDGEIYQPVTQCMQRRLAGAI
jgi:hypothetical protein